MRRLAENDFDPVPVLVEKGGEWIRREISWVNVPTGWVCCFQYIDAESTGDTAEIVWNEVYELDPAWEFGECPSPHGWHNQEKLTPEELLQRARETFRAGDTPTSVRLLTRDEVGKRPNPSGKIYWGEPGSIHGGLHGDSTALTYWTTAPYGTLPPVTKYRFPECSPYGWSSKTGELIPTPEGYELMPEEDLNRGFPGRYDLIYVRKDGETKEGKSLLWFPRLPGQPGTDWSTIDAVFYRRVDREDPLVRYTSWQGLMAQDYQAWQERRRQKKMEDLFHTPYWTAFQDHYLRSLWERACEDVQVSEELRPNQNPCVEVDLPADLLRDFWERVEEDAELRVREAVNAGTERVVEHDWRFSLPYTGKTFVDVTLTI